MTVTLKVHRINPENDLLVVDDYEFSDIPAFENYGAVLSWTNMMDPRQSYGVAVSSLVSWELGWSE